MYRFKWAARFWSGGCQIKKFVVITSINPPRFEKLKLFTDADYEVVIVGDRKTDEAAWNIAIEKVHFLSYKAQEDISLELSNLIGPNSYARKNFGYIFALRLGADVILDTDDDTFFRDSVNCPIEFIKNASWFEYKAEETFNPYQFFAYGERMWPRGYPLREIVNNLNNGKPELRQTTNSQVDILQFLVSGDPDVDAIFRLTVSPEPKLFGVSHELVNLGKDSYVPANTQAAFWINRAGFEFLYIPRNVAFRFCDILKMFVAQSTLTLAYGGFLFEQIRNDHDLIKDFESEVDVYLKTELTIQTLREHKMKNIEDCYISLSQVGVVPEDEVKIATLFASLMNEYINR